MRQQTAHLPEILRLALSSLNPCERNRTGIDSARNPPMSSMHSFSKGQREVVGDLLRKVLVSDMGNFNPERFKDWVKNTDNQFRKMGLTLQFQIHDRTVHFTVKELRTGRRLYQFATSTRVRFDDGDVIMSYEEITRGSR